MSRRAEATGCPPDPLRDKATVISSERLHPLGDRVETATALSLLDASTANFSLTCAVWLFEAPAVQADIDVVAHLKQTLQTTLGAYPHLCGQLKSFASLDSTSPDRDATRHFPPAARRFGRVYVHYGSSHDPGVELVIAQSTATLDDLCPSERKPVWDRTSSDLSEYLSKTKMGTPLKPMTPSEGLYAPSLSIQVTTLACGAFILSARLLHPLGDITSLICFLKDWASISRSVLSGSQVPQLNPVFQPEDVDAQAAGDIDADIPDVRIVESTRTLPLHRFDWWAEPDSCPWGVKVPEAFQGRDIVPVGRPMPWQTWNLADPVSSVLLHLTSSQVQKIWEASASTTAAVSISKHDAILAHIWACINRARLTSLSDNPVVHCNLTVGARRALGLGSTCQGSVTIITNIAVPARQVCAASPERPAELQALAQSVRSTLDTVNNGAAIGAHLHSLAYESSPQRIWRAFLGSQHILVTTWARAGVYDVDFGFKKAGDGPAVRFVDAVLSDLDGLVLIDEASPVEDSRRSVGGADGSWTAGGVDITLKLRTEDMRRLVQDPLLLP